MLGGKIPFLPISTFPQPVYMCTIIIIIVYIAATAAGSVRMCKPVQEAPWQYYKTKEQ